MSLDDIDNKILTELQKDADRSNISLAKQIGVSEATVRRRIEALKDAGVIRIVAVPQPAMLGYHVAAIINCQVAVGKAESVADTLAGYSNMIFVGTVTGRFDVLAWGVFASSSHLSDFLGKTLPQIEGLISTETCVVLGAKKLAYTLEPRTSG